MIYNIEIKSEAGFGEIKQLLLEHFQNFKLSSGEEKYSLGEYSSIKKEE